MTHQTPGWMSNQAAAIAKAYANHPGMTWDKMRDRIDIRTGGELDCQPLDILTDMVMARIKGLVDGENDQPKA